jgi:hypothetical protein
MLHMVLVHLNCSRIWVKFWINVMNRFTVTLIKDLDLKVYIKIVVLGSLNLGL